MDFGFHFPDTTATRLQLTAHLEFISACNAQMFTGMTKVIEANMQATRDALTNSTTRLEHLLASDQDPGAFWANNPLAASTARKVAYAQRLSDIAQETRQAYTLLMQERADDVKRECSVLLEEIADKVPDSAQNSLETVRKIFQDASNSYLQMLHTTEAGVQLTTGKFAHKERRSTSGKMRTVEKTASA